MLDAFPRNEDRNWQQQPLTGPQGIITQGSRLPTDLAAKKAACLDSERVVMTQLQVGNLKEIVGSIPEVSCDIHGIIKHVYLVALETDRQMSGSCGQSLSSVTAASCVCSSLQASADVKALWVLTRSFSLPLRYWIQNKGTFPSQVSK